jgi:hypothetical protein
MINIKVKKQAATVLQPFIDALQVPTAMPPSQAAAPQAAATQTKFKF